MAFVTLSNLTASDVGQEGIHAFSNTVLSADNLNTLGLDLLSPARESLLAGVLSGGICTASGLNVTIPANTSFVAQQYWVTESSVVVSVPNSATTYIWLCADGQSRQTTTTTPPDGFTLYTACIATKATAAGGNATLDNTVQHKARSVDPETRIVTDGNLSIDPEGETVTVTGIFDVTEGITVNGSAPENYILLGDGQKFIPSALPTLPVPINIPAENIGTGAVNDTELSYMNGATSNLQTQLDARPIYVSSVSNLSSQTANTVVVRDTTRGGTFTLISSGSSANNGTTFASATGGYLYQRVMNGEDYNVLWFGAVGDGSTDDSAAIQAAVDATPDGGTLFFPKTASYYKITAYLTISASITLRGATDGVEIKQVTVDQGIFDISASDVVIERLTLTGRQYTAYRPWNGGENAIKCNGVSNASRLSGLTVRHCVIQTWGSIAIQSYFVDNIRVENCILQNLNEAGIQAICCNYGSVTGCIIKNIVGDAVGDGGASPPIGVNSSVYGIIITRTGDTDTSLYPRPTYWNVANNRIQDVVWEGLDTHGGQYITFADNVITNCYGAIVVNYAQSTGGTELLAPKDVTICGNVIYGRTDGTCTFGISVTGAQNGTTVAEYAERIAITGNTIYGHGNQTLQNSGAIYCRTTMGLVVASNVMIEPSCCGLVLSNENYHYTITGNNIIDCWSDTGGNVGMGIRIYAAGSIGNNTGTISSNNFGRDTATGKSGSVVSVCNRAIEIGNYTGNEAQIGLNRYDAAFTYRVLDTGNLGSTTFNTQLKLPTSGSTGGVLMGTDVALYRNAAEEMYLTARLVGTETSDKRLRQVVGFVGGWMNESNTIKTVFGMARNRLARANRLAGFSVASSPAISSGSLDNLWADDSNGVLYNSPSGNIILTLTVPSFTSMQVLVVSQHVTYYATTCLVEYSTDGGASYTTFQTVTNLKGGTENGIDTSTMPGTITNIRLTFSSFNSGTYFQLYGIGWTHPNSPTAAWAFNPDTGGSIYGNTDITGTLTVSSTSALNGNTTVTGTLRASSNSTTGGTNTFTATPSPTIVHRITAAASSSGVAALQLYTPDGTKNPRVHYYQDTSGNACGFQINASSGTGMPDFVIYRDTTLYMQLNMNSTTGNLGRLSLPVTGSGAGLMLGGDAQIFRGSADRVDLASGDSFNIVSGSLQVNGTSVLTSARALQNIAGLTLDDATNIVLNTTTGTKIGTATTQKLGFWNATPVVQPSAAAQAAVATTAATNTTPYGYSTAAQADGIITLLNEIRTVLVNTGLMKGSA